MGCFSRPSPSYRRALSGLLLGYEIPIKNILFPDSARALLGAIAGGMISLMVFSFSMVMVIRKPNLIELFSPLLPNLIGQRSKQIVMGFYIGTIAYTFTVLTSINSKLYAFGVPTLSIIVNSLLSLVCLALFVSFINDVSKDIQIGNIINHVYQDTLRSMRREIEENLRGAHHAARYPRVDHDSKSSFGLSQRGE